MADDNGEDMNDDEVVDAKSNKGEDEVFQYSVDYILHPMIAQVCGEAHLFYGVMDFMELPQPRDMVKHAVNIPVDKVTYHKEDKELSPGGPRI